MINPKNSTTMGHPVKTSPSSWLERQFPGEDIQSPFFTLEKQQGVRAIYIDFQFMSGNQLALPCADIRKIEFDPSRGIGIVWSDETLWILGRHLQPLYQYLVRHRVSAIMEDGGEAHAENTLVITELKREEEWL